MCGAPQVSRKKEFLRQFHCVALRAIGRLQQPATEPRFDGVQKVTGSGDAGLVQQYLIVPDAKVPHDRTVVHGLAELARGYDRRSHLQLNHNPHGRFVEA
jgi:hypothetical protein